MSEYQYYEFLALDRPLTDKEQRELRAISTRAEISPTHFRNEYHWGDLKADPMQLLARYFDVHVYVANWGEHRLAMRFSKDLIDVKEWRPYCLGHGLRIVEEKRAILLEFSAHEEAHEFVTDADTYMPALSPLRQAILRGDLRALYLGWLACVQEEDIDDAKPEPPVPAGLLELDGPLHALCEFLFLNEDLRSVAASASPSLQNALPAGLADFVAALPELEKNRLLLDLVTGKEPDPGARLLKEFRRSQGSSSGKKDAGTGRRSVGRLLKQTEEVRAAREHLEAEANRRAIEKIEQERASARAKYLDTLAGRKDTLWEQVHTLVAKKQPKPYQDALLLLRDLRDLAERDGEREEFQNRLAALAALHAKKTTLLAKIKEAELWP